MIFRNNDLLAVVRRLDCVHCGITGRTEAAHSNQLRFGKGRGIKGSDAAIMALCRTDFGSVGCHAELDQGAHMTKLERWAFEYEHIALTLIALIEQGYLVVDKERLK
jgi:hydroxyethylthiazole kinase-like sugar kinase family protein